MEILGYSILTRTTDLLLEMDNQTIKLLNSYYRKCVEIDFTDANFEKIIVITCVLMAEARMSLAFPAELNKTCLSIEWKIKKFIQQEKVRSIDFLHKQQSNII